MNEQSIFKKVKSISFGIFSPQMVKNMASVKIVTPELYDKEGYPADGGLMDVKLGVIDPGLKCNTCGGQLKECIGHFGYIELARPVIHYKFVRNILNLLRGTCSSCGKALAQEADIKKYVKNIRTVLEEETAYDAKVILRTVLAKLRMSSKCPHCNTAQKAVKLEKPTSFYEDGNRLSPIEIRSRLEKIPDEHLYLFGMNPKTVRPEWTILTVMPIPPVTIRPSITLESGERSEDDLTHKLSDIVRINQRLFENINAGAPEIIIEDLWDLLQYHITTYFDNEVSQLPPARHRGGQPLKTLTDRIKSKEGRIRHNLAGKRTNYSARTVISPDPLIHLNEVGIPSMVAMKLTVPERATEWNMDYLKEFVKKGPKKYPGANYIVRPDGKKKKITDETKEALLEEIQPGYVVERHLMNGDVCIFNRQPSLHRMNMMCHKIRILPGLTFRLNPAVSHPYNADFDGDEMNLHIPQTEEARAEAETLMLVQTQLISPGYGQSVIGCKQDFISGNYILSQKEDILRTDAINMLYSIGVTDFSRLPRKEKVTGRDVFSCTLPDDFSYVGQSKDGKEVLIEHGKLVKGIMDKNSLLEGSGLMLRQIHKKYGDEKTVEIIGLISKLGLKALIKYGFSTGVSDTDLPDEALSEIKSILDKADYDVNELIEKFKKFELDIFPGKTLLESLELHILQCLNRARNKTGEVVGRSLKENTGCQVMVQSGARGNALYLAQIAGCIGQQSFRGGRIERGYRNRALSCFKKNDFGPEAHGFIRSSFKSGLSPHEFFFIAMTGRDGLMDTALRTPKSGYLYRRLGNALQDVHVEYDNTVRDATGQIVQFTYGEDLVDVSKSDGGKINIKNIIKQLQ